MKADLINELARLRDELRNVSTKIDNAIENATAEANSAPPRNAPAPFGTPFAPTAPQFVVLTEPEEDFLRNWMDSAARPQFTDWERSFLDSVLQRNMQFPTIKLTQRQYDSFIKIFIKHEAAK